jgi:hypothetical protein
VTARDVALTPDVPDADMPVAAFDGDAWGVVYVISEMTGGRGLRFLRSTVDGTLVGEPLSLTASFELPFVKPSIAWTGTRFVVAWGEGNEVRLQGLSPAGDAVAWRRRLPAGEQSQAVVRSAGGELLLVYTSTTRVDAVHLARFDDSGRAVGSPTELTERAQHNGVDAEWSSRGELAITFQRSRTPDRGTHLVRVGEGARWVSAPGLVDDRVSDTPGAAVAVTDTEYGVAYPTPDPRTGGIFFRRVGCEEL